MTTSNQSPALITTGDLDSAIHTDNYKLTQHKVIDISKQIKRKRSHSQTILLP